VISPEGRYLAGPLAEGEGLAIAELDRALITKRKRMMDSIGHYSRPDILGLRLNAAPASQVELIGAFERPPGLAGAPGSGAAGAALAEQQGAGLSPLMAEVPHG
jgi:nitrilase/aliphatic nitrilase